ncbi:hypothetical protein [Levilactobacillus zymae]|uniref:hypothetical protein n=1 Tax=Levilactobacillus zymae TaxID=267363 RepID=UPI000B254517|nr:hypothetical protein [Levilactobacillus zymae]QFR61238.1 hypothetical protein LZ395_06775 [Levilactobacillus zymae]
MTWKRWLCLAGVLVAGGSWGQPVARAASQRPTQDNLENARIINYWIKANDIGGGGYKTRLYKTVLTHQDEDTAVPQLSELIDGSKNFDYDPHQTIQGEVTDVIYTSKQMADEKVIFVDVDDHEKVGSEILYFAVKDAAGGWPVLPLPDGYELVNPEDAYRPVMNSSSAWHIKIRKIDKLGAHRVPQLPSDHVTVVTPPSTETSSQEGASNSKPPVEVPHVNEQPGTTTTKPVPPAPTLPGPQPGPSQSGGAHDGGQPINPKPMPDGSADKAPHPGQSSAGKPNSNGPQSPTQRPLPVPKDPQPATPQPAKPQPQPQPGPVVVGPTPTQPQGQPGKQPTTERPAGPVQPGEVPERPTHPIQPVEPTTDQPQVPQRPETPQLTPPQSHQSPHQSQPAPQSQKKPTGPGATAPAGPHHNGSGHASSTLVTPPAVQPSPVRRPHRGPANPAPAIPQPVGPVTADSGQRPVLSPGRPVTKPHSALQETLAMPLVAETDSRPQSRPDQFNHVAELGDADNQTPTKSRHAAHRHPHAHRRHHMPVTKVRITTKAKTAASHRTSRLPQTAGQPNRWAGLGWLLLGTTLTSPWVYRRLH